MAESAPMATSDQLKPFLDQRVTGRSWRSPPSRKGREDEMERDGEGELGARV